MVAMAWGEKPFRWKVLAFMAFTEKRDAGQGPNQGETGQTSFSWPCSSGLQGSWQPVVFFAQSTVCCDLCLECGELNKTEMKAVTLDWTVAA